MGIQFLNFILYNPCLGTFAGREQSGAVEACWAHNPEVRRSKLRSATVRDFFVDNKFF